MIETIKNICLCNKYKIVVIKSKPRMGLNIVLLNIASQLNGLIKYNYGKNDQSLFILNDLSMDEALFKCYRSNIDFNFKFLQITMKKFTISLINHIFDKINENYDSIKYIFVDQMPFFDENSTLIYFLQKIKSSNKIWIIGDTLSNDGKNGLNSSNFSILCDNCIYFNYENENLEVLYDRAV